MLFSSLLYIMYLILTFSCSAAHGGVTPRKTKDIKLNIIKSSKTQKLKVQENSQANISYKLMVKFEVWVCWSDDVQSVEVLVIMSKSH